MLSDSMQSLDLHVSSVHAHAVFGQKPACLSSLCLYIRSTKCEASWVRSERPLQSPASSGQTIETGFSHFRKPYLRKIKNASTTGRSRPSNENAILGGQKVYRFVDFSLCASQKQGIFVTAYHYEDTKSGRVRVHGNLQQLKASQKPGCNHCMCQTCYQLFRSCQPINVQCIL